MSFKKGDRVRLTVAHPCGDGRSGPPLGACGVVVEHTSGGTRPLVKFDDWSGGHHTERACWWVPMDKLARETTTAFKKGDRVGAIKAYDGKKPTGVGTVTSADKGMVRVTWDTWSDGHGPEDRNWCYSVGLGTACLRLAALAPPTAAPPTAAHTFKIGDRGLTRDGRSYEILERNDELFAVRINDEKTYTRHCYSNGRCFRDGRDHANDLLPPSVTTKPEETRFMIGDRVYDAVWTSPGGRYGVIVPHHNKDWVAVDFDDGARGFTYTHKEAEEHLQHGFKIGDVVEAVEGSQRGKRGVVLAHPRHLAVRFEGDMSPEGFTYDRGTKKLRYVPNTEFVSYAPPATCPDSVTSDAVVDIKTRGFCSGDRVVYSGESEDATKSWVGLVGTVVHGGKSSATVGFDDIGERICFGVNLRLLSPFHSVDPPRTHATPYDDVAAGDFGVTVVPTPPKENAVNLLSPVKIEERTYITLPGQVPANIKDMSDEKLLSSIQQAENGIEELKKLQHKPQVVVQQIKDLEAGIKAVVNVLDARYRERNPSTDTAAPDPAAG